MTRQPIDELMRPREVDRWADEYKAHITAIENRQFFGKGSKSSRGWVYFTERNSPPAARPHKFKPADDPGLLDPDFDEE